MNGLHLSMILHLVYTYVFWRKSKCLSIHNLISIWFSFIVVMGLITVETGIYQATHGSFVKFPFEPYIMEFVSFVIFMWPFRYLNEKNIVITDIIRNSPKIDLIIKGLIFLFSLYLIVCIQSAYYVSQQNLVDAYYSNHLDGASLYNYNNLQSKIIWICGTSYNIFLPLVLLYAIVGLSQNPKRNKMRFYFLCILICVACDFFASVSNGRRGNVFWFTVTMGLVFIPLWNMFSRRIQNIFKSCVPIIVTVFALYAVIMTIQRVEDSTTETPITTVMRYLGEPYPHLGNVFWEKVLFHPMGMRLYPFIVDPISMVKDSQSLRDSHLIWESITGVPILNYKTLYGDFYVDFGKWLPFVLIFIYSFILYLFTKKRKISFWAYPILFYYINLAVNAPLWFSKRDWDGVKDLLFAIGIYLVGYIFFIKKTKV